MTGRGVAYRKTDETGLQWSKRGSCWSGGVWHTAKRSKQGPVHREGCGVPQNGTPRDTVHLHHRPPPASTGYYSSTIDLLQPPPATVHPRAPVHPASTTRYSTGYCSTTPLHGLLFNHPFTGYCSSTPPPSTVLPALHGVVLFIQPSTGSCSSSPNRLYRSGSCSSRGNATAHCSSKPPPPQRSLFIRRGSIHWLQLAAVAKESLDRV